MQVESKDVGIAAFVLSQLGVIFGVGRAYGVLSRRVVVLEDSSKAMAEEVAGFDAETEAKIEKAFKQLDLKISTIDQKFNTANGEPRFVSYKAHDKLQQHCQQHLLAEMGHVCDSVDKLDKQMGGFNKQMTSVLETLAVLSSKQKDGE